jgi:hypothetical protein
MHGPLLFRCNLDVAGSPSLEEYRDRKAAAQVGDPVGIPQEDVRAQTPIVGVERRVDRNTANDDRPERHESENMVEHASVSLRRASELQM